MMDQYIADTTVRSRRIKEVAKGLKPSCRGAYPDDRGPLFSPLKLLCF